MDLYSVAPFISSITFSLGNLASFPPILLYLGPETMMPLGSFLAASIGILLVFWRHVVTLVSSSFNRVFHRKRSLAETNSELNSDMHPEIHTEMTPD